MKEWYSPCKGINIAVPRHSLLALSGLEILDVSRSQGVALGCDLTAFQAEMQATGYTYFCLICTVKNWSTNSSWSMNPSASRPTWGMELEL